MPVPTTPEEAVYARLSSGVDLTALVGDRLTPQLTDQELALPCVVYQRTGKDAKSRLNGTSRLGKYTVTVTAYGNTESQAHRVSNAVHDRLCPDEPWTDFAAGVQGCFAGDSTEDVEEGGVYSVARPFDVWWQPPTARPAPLAYYPLDGAGTDGSGNGLNLTGGIYGNPAGGGSPKFGTHCLTRTTASSATGLGLAAGDLAVSMWVYFVPSASGVDATTGFLDAATTGLLAVTINRTSATAAVVLNGATVFTSSALSAGTWHHVAVSASGGVVWTWVDGTLVDARAGTPAGAVDRLRVGASGTNASAIDDAALVRAALSQTQVSYLYNGGTGRTYL